MKSIETSGKTVEAAVKNGLKELGCESSDVDIEILEMGSPGLFGMFGKLAKVRLTVKEKEDEFKIDMPVLSLDIDRNEKKNARKAEAPKQEKPRTEAKPRAEQPVKAEKPEPEKPAPAQESAPVAAQTEESAPEAQEEKPQEIRPRRERPARRRKAEKPRQEPVQVEEHTEPTEPEMPFVPAEPQTWSEAARMAVEFLSNTTRMMGVEVSIEVCEGEDTLHVRMNGDTLGVLIGRRGETLDALQYLTSLYVNKGREGYLRVSLDSENYRAKREEALRKLAVRMAQRARKSGHRVVLEPMNPYERRILHSALQGNPYVQTHSEGEDPYRRVIITLK